MHDDSALHDAVLRTVHGLTGPAGVGLDTPLMDAGIDSLTAANFVSELSQRTALQLSPTLIFEHSTAEAVAQHLMQLLGGNGVRTQFETLGAREGRSWI